MSAGLDSSPGPEVPWLATLQGLARDLPGLLSDRIELFSLEMRRAGRVLAQMVALIVAVAILGVSAWLALCACVVGALMAAGLPWAAALLVLLLCNAALCAAAVQRLRRLAPQLALPATRRHLTAHSAPAPAPAAMPEPAHAAAAT